jgi:hypothetical protein
VIRGVDEEASLAGRILALAQPRALPILLVGVARDAVRAAALRRTLVTIAAFLRAQSLSAGANSSGRAPTQIELLVEQGPDWLGRVARLVQPGDMLACVDAEVGGARHRPLNDILSSRLKMPMYTFTSVRDIEQGRRKMIPQIAAWLTSLGSIAGFMAVQVRIVLMAQGWLQSVLLLVTVLAEVGMVWLLNSLFA